MTNVFTLITHFLKSEKEITKVNKKLKRPRKDIFLIHGPKVKNLWTPSRDPLPPYTYGLTMKYEN